jgi:hypothetical protein
MTESCAKCGKELQCEAAQIDACWCSSYPAVLPPGASSECLCSDCLKEKLAPVMAKIVEDVKAGRRENDVARLSAPLNKLIEGIDYYLDGGRWVLTEWFFLKRGYCCGSGCRHCPFDHVNVKKNARRNF